MSQVSDIDREGSQNVAKNSQKSTSGKIQGNGTLLKGRWIAYYLLYSNYSVTVLPRLVRSPRLVRLPV